MGKESLGVYGTDVQFHRCGKSEDIRIYLRVGQSCPPASCERCGGTEAAGC